MSERQWPAPMAPEAYHGPIGTIVRGLGPETEADPAALIVALLVGFGNLIGRTVGIRRGAVLHRTNEYALIVGASSRARKGTAWAEVEQVLGRVAPHWLSECLATGLSSGEGLAYRVRDPVRDPSGDDDDEPPKVRDPGASDKRLLIAEDEFSQPLRTMKRDGNILSEYLRTLWDRGYAGALTKHDPTRATNAHVSIVGAIVAEALREEMTRVHLRDGFANRFLFVCAKRSRSLPHGGNLVPAELDGWPAVDALRTALTWAEHPRELSMVGDAICQWVDVYDDYLMAERPGVLDALTARAAPHVLRLAVIYAVADCSYGIEAVHLAAALAVWDYCEASVSYLFGDAVGPTTAERVLVALRDAGTAGMTRTELRDLFNRNEAGEVINAALRSLVRRRLAWGERTATGGRPAERWQAEVDDRSRVDDQRHLRSLELLSSSTLSPGGSVSGATPEDVEEGRS